MSFSAGVKGEMLLLLRFHCFHRNNAVSQRFAVKPSQTDCFSYGCEGRYVAPLMFHCFHRNNTVNQWFAVKPSQTNCFSCGCEGRNVASSFIGRPSVNDAGLYEISKPGRFGARHEFGVSIIQSLTYYTQRPVLLYSAT